MQQASLENSVHRLDRVADAPPQRVAVRARAAMLVQIPRGSDENALACPIVLCYEAAPKHRSR